MKIRNEFIKIKQGKREITLKNFIYDDYLSLFSTTQYDNGEDINALYEKQQEKEFYNCFVRFDDELEDITDAILTDFDIYCIGNVNLKKQKNKTETTYNFNVGGGYDINNPGSLINISDYYGKKITAIGFGRNEKIYACLDMSNYEIYIIENETLKITRKDIINTEAIAFGNDFPVHLSPVGDYGNEIYNPISMEYERKYAKLYSVGFAKTMGVMSEEFIIGDDIDIKIIDDTSFSFNFKKGEDISIYPNNNFYAGNNIYPLPLYVAHETYPNLDLFPDNNLFPTDSNYKYVIYKFRKYIIHWIGQNFNDGLELQELDEFYEMYLENNTKGLFEIITKIERS